MRLCRSLDRSKILVRRFRNLQLIAWLVNLDEIIPVSRVLGTVRV